MVAAGCRSLNKRIEVYLDGELVELPELEAIVILNIPSWGAGVDLWGNIFDTLLFSFRYSIIRLIRYAF